MKTAKAMVKRQSSSLFKPSFFGAFLLWVKVFMFWFNVLRVIALSLLSSFKKTLAVVRYLFFVLTLKSDLLDNSRL